MAVTFTDLHTESGLKSLDEFLSGKSYISGFPGKAVGVRVGGQAAASEALRLPRLKLPSSTVSSTQ